MKNFGSKSAKNGLKLGEKMARRRRETDQIFGEKWANLAKMC
jgi:hypothetical protein